MRKLILLVISLTIITLFYSFYTSQNVKVNETDKVLDVLVKLGDKAPLHYRDFNKLDTNIVKQGYDIFTQGFTIDKNGKKSKRQSKHFVCTDCHNMQIEDPDLTKSNPDTRLEYVAKNKLNFLPGTTMAGTVNKEHWYNDDYIKKYGSLVIPANDTLKNAIHLCAVECSQGRALENWEMEAMLQFFNSIGYTISDIKLNEQEISTINKALNTSEGKEKAVELIKSKYLNYSPATFLNPTPKNERKLGANGNPKIGEQIYELSCLTCHKEKGVTNYKLNKEKLTFNQLKYWADKHSLSSVYEITRKGTYAMPGYKPYMPNYTKERLSDEQLEDLMAYINQESNK